MNEWEEYYDVYRPISSDKMIPDTFNECFVNTAETVKLKKWIKIFKICGIVFIVLFLIAGFITSFNNAYIVEKGNYSWQQTKSFDMAIFFVYLLVYAILDSMMFLCHMLVCSVLSCIAQINRNTGISARLYAFNTKKQKTKGAKEEEEN